MYWPRRVASSPYDTHVSNTRPQHWRAQPRSICSILLIWCLLWYQCQEWGERRRGKEKQREDLSHLSRTDILKFLYKQRRLLASFTFNQISTHHAPLLYFELPFPITQTPRPKRAPPPRLMNLDTWKLWLRDGFYHFWPQAFWAINAQAHSIKTFNHLDSQGLGKEWSTDY